MLNFLFLFFIFFASWSSWIGQFKEARGKSKIQLQIFFINWLGTHGKHPANASRALPADHLPRPPPFFLSTQSNSPFPPVISAQPVVRYGAWRTAQAIFSRPLECSTDALERKGNEDCKILEIGALGRKTHRFWSEASGECRDGTSARLGCIWLAARVLVHDHPPFAVDKLLQK